MQNSAIQNSTTNTTPKQDTIILYIYIVIIEQHKNAYTTN